MSAPALLALALAAAAPRLEASLAAGAGYDSNLSHAASASDRVDGVFGFLGAGGGVAIDLGATTSVYLGPRLDLERFADGGQGSDLSDLGSTSAALEGALLQRVGRRVALILAPSVFRAWTGDPARDTTGFSGRLTLRVKPTPHVALRAFTSYGERRAADPVFSSYPYQLGGSAEWSPRGRTFLSVGYSERHSEEVFYRSVATGSGPGPGGRRVSTFAGLEEAYRARALSRTLSAGLELGLGAGLHLLASYQWSRVTSDEPTFVVHAATVGLGARR